MPGKILILCRHNYFMCYNLLTVVDIYMDGMRDKAFHDHIFTYLSPSSEVNLKYVIDYKKDKVLPCFSFLNTSIYDYQLSLYRL